MCVNGLIVSKSVFKCNAMLQHWSVNSDYSCRWPGGRPPRVKWCFLPEAWSRSWVLVEVEWGGQRSAQRKAGSVCRRLKASALTLTPAVACCSSVMWLWLTQVSMNVKPGMQGAWPGWPFSLPLTHPLPPPPPRPPPSGHLGPKCPRRTPPSGPGWGTTARLWARMWVGNPSTLWAAWPSVLWELPLRPPSLWASPCWLWPPCCWSPWSTADITNGTRRLMELRRCVFVPTDKLEELALAWLGLTKICCTCQTIVFWHSTLNTFSLLCLVNM